MILVYVGKGVQESPNPIIHVFETDLSKDELISTIEQEKEAFVQEEFGDEQPYDYYIHEFVVEISGREYGFCLGDHTFSENPGYFLYTLDELLNKKIKFNHEDLI